MKKILIIGSGGNFGKYAFNKLKKTYKVIGIQRTKTKTKTKFICDDLSNYELTLKIFRSIKKSHKKLDAIIISIGDSKKSSIANLSKKLIYSINSNLITITNSIESYLKVYKNMPTKIIVLSSIAGIKIIDAPIEYSISKAALNHYCKIRAKELSKFNIRLNVISPGNMLHKNNVWDLKLKINYKKIKTYIKKSVPLNTFCKPNEILALCDLLISENGNFYQGSNLVIDGGQHL